MSMLRKGWWGIKKSLMRLSGSYAHTGERVSPEIPDENFQAHLQVYQFMAQFVKGKTVLDVGCGTGYGANYLLEQGAGSVWGVDHAGDAIAYAKKHYTDPRISFREMNAEVLSLPNDSFDVVTSSENLEHLKNPSKCIAEIKRVLKRKGLLVLGTPNKELSSPGAEKSGNPFHEKEFTFEELDSLLRKHFRSVFIFENTLQSPHREGRKMKEERGKRGKTGMEPGDRKNIRVGHIQVDLTHLKNTHSFMVIAW